MDPKTMPVKLLRQAEVAKIVRKSEAWLERMRWQGNGIPYRKIGRHVIYSESDILKWIASHPLQTCTTENPEEGSK